MLLDVNTKYTSLLSGEIFTISCSTASASGTLTGSVG